MRLGTSRCRRGRTETMLTLVAKVFLLMMMGSASVSAFASRQVTSGITSPWDAIASKLSTSSRRHGTNKSCSALITSLYATKAENDEAALQHNEKESRSQEGSIAKLRTSLRTATGFSLTALRTTCRAATGVSLTAIYLATLAATGNWIRQTTKFALSIFPPWARYFVQPFLIFYYVPIFILRNVTGPTRRRARKTHEAVLDSWKEAVEKADETVAYWPIHVDNEGHFESDLNEIDMRKGVLESIEIARDEKASSSVPSTSSSRQKQQNSDNHINNNKKSLNQNNISRRDLMSWAVVGLTASTVLGASAPALARLEGVNKPELLPKEPGLNVIQTEKFLTSGQAKRMDQLLANLERDTGYRVRVLCQAYPNTPGLAIRDYWDLGKEGQKDDKYIVLVVDQFGGKGNVLNFNVGEGTKFALPNGE